MARKLTAEEIASRFAQADALVAEAGTALYRAQRLFDDVDFHGAIEAAQHSVEFAVKAILTFTAIPFERTHDVSKQLDKASLRVGGLEQYQKEMLARLKWISPMWAWANVSAVYGSLDVPASRLFKSDDARIAIEYAREASNTAQIILSTVRYGQGKLLEE
jgi:HEPN domain-containing protein